LILLLLPLIATTISRFNREIRAKAHTAQNELAHLSSLVEEAGTGFKEIKSFANEGLVKDRFRQANHETVEAYTRQDKLRALGPPTVSIIAFLGFASLMLLSAWEVFRDVSSIGDVTAFFTCLLLSYSPIERMSESFGGISRMYAVVDRFRELLSAPEENKASNDPACPAVIRGTIEFSMVGFSYPQGFRLHDLNLFIDAGETVVITGPNGSGKTTLLNLIPRFLECDTGTIRIDGVDIRKYGLLTLRKQIGFVFQEPVLFDGTLLENLSFAKPEASMEEILAAARAAGVSFIAIDPDTGEFDGEDGFAGPFQNLAEWGQLVGFIH